MLPKEGCVTFVGAEAWRAVAEPTTRMSFDGGYVERGRRYWGSLNGFVPSRSGGWYDTQWAMLTRRLRYGGRKARSARRRIVAHWGAKVLREFELQISDGKPSEGSS
jgi:hypothetical protein